MDEKNTNLQADDTLAVLDPENYVLSNPTPRDWNMTAQDIARSLKITPYESVTTKAQREGEQLNIAETIGTGIWDAIKRLPKSISETVSVANIEAYSSPNMTEKEAARLLQDALYTRHFGRKAEDILTSDKIKYKTLYNISGAVGDLIKYAGIGIIGGLPAVTAVAGAEAYSETEAAMVDSYIDKKGTIEGYEKKRGEDVALAGAYGVFSGLTETALGVERIAAGALNRYGRMEAAARLARQKGQLYKSAALRAGRRFGMSALEEGAEEFVQQIGEDTAKYWAGYEDAVFTDENFKKAITAAAYGALIGGPAGWGLYRINRQTLINKINDWNNNRKLGMTEQQVIESADQILDESKTTMLDEIATRAEIKNGYGEAFNTVKARIAELIDATGTTPWTDQNKTKEQYVEDAAKAVTLPAIIQANKAQLPLSDFLEVADLNVTDTSSGKAPILNFTPIATIDDLQRMLDEQNAIIKEENDAAKIGNANPERKQSAQRRKAILQYHIRAKQLENGLQNIRRTHKKEQADYVTAKDLQPEQTATLDTAVQAEEGQDYVLFAGKRIPVEYQVVELSTIQPSHINGTPNPLYTNTALQNRASRGTTQDVADLREKATNITPERLLRATTSAEGAPVVNERGEVIAGNGRAEIVRYAYENPESAEKYKTALANAGFNIEGMERPILIRKNTTMTDSEQVAAADISNISETSAFDEASQARRDTQYLKDSATPIDFASKLPMSERRGLMQNNGRWNKRRVQQRYEDALLSWLTGNDTQLFENLVLDRGISQKVIDILTNNGAQIYELATKYPELGIREDIYHALQKMQIATRDNFIELTQQVELDGRDVMPENIIIWNWLFTDGTTNRQFMSNYLSTIQKNVEAVNAGQDMFGDTIAPLSKKDALMQALKKTDEARAQTAAERGKEYEGLFTQETEEVKNPELSAAIASYNNQFAVSSNNILNQIVYVSLKGELIGDALDADKFLGTGDNTRVWLWGNYSLLSKEIDKKHYFDRFEREGPKLMYDGKEVTSKLLDELGLSSEFYVTSQIRNDLKSYASNITYKKEDLVKSAESRLKDFQQHYKNRVQHVVNRLVRHGWNRKEINQMIKDMEAIARGDEGWAGIGLKFNKGTPEYEIQQKYRDADGKLDQKFVDLYVELVNEFEQIASQFNYNGFIGSVRRLNAIENTIKAIKKLDWSKFTGRTGFTYKGEHFTGTLSQIIADTGLYEPDRNYVFNLVDETVTNALKYNKDVNAALKELDKKYTKFTDLIPEVKKAIEKAVNKHNAKYEPKANAKAVVDTLEKYMLKPQQTLRGFSPSIIIDSDYYLLDTLSQELLKEVAKDTESGINIPDWTYKDAKPTIADIIARIKTANTRLTVLRHVQDFFKDSTNADFEYKPMASMYSAEAPEDDVLLNASKKLDKQPKKVQEAIIKTIREYGQKYPELHMLNTIYSGIPRSYREEQARMFEKIFGFNMEEAAAFISDRITERLGEDYSNNADEYLWDVLYEGIDYALIMKDNPTLSDVVEGIKKWKERIENDRYRNPNQKIKEEISIDYVLENAENQNLKQSVSEFTKGLSDFKGIELSDENAFKFLSRLVNLLKLNPNVLEELQKDKSLKLTKNAPADEVIVKMFRKNGIQGLKYYGKRDKRGIVTWQRTPVKELLYSKDLSKNLVATHAMSKIGVKEALKVGGLAMPSIAISKSPQNHYGEIIFVAPSSMAQPSRTTNIYDRDAWTPMINFIEYNAKEGFYDRVKDILLVHGYDPKATSTFVANIENNMNGLGGADGNGPALILFGTYKGWMPYNASEVREKLETDKDLRDEYYDWYDNFISSNMIPRIFRGFTELGNRRYAAATLKNIVRELKTQPEHKDISSDFYLFSDVVRTLVNRYKSTKEIKKASERILDYNESQKKVDELHSDFNVLALELRTDDTNHMPELSLAQAIIDGEGSTAEKLESVGLKHDKNSVKKVDEMVNKIKNIPVHYFEGKVRRAVTFDEFSAVFVPQLSSYNDIASELSEQGANVIRYDSSYDLDNKFNQLTQENDNILFQRGQTLGFYDPELQAIVLGKNWNETTLVHEFHHRYLEKIWGIYKQAVAGVKTVAPAFMEDTQKLFEMLEIDPKQDQLTAVQQEKFASMVESYLTGLGVDNADNLAFKAFLHWIPEKYKSVMDIGYLDEQGNIQNPFLDQESIEFFDKWFASPFAPSLPSAPQAQRLVNVTDDKDQIVPSTQKVMNNREKEWGQDSEEQNTADAQLWRAIGENNPSDIRAAMDGEQELMKAEAKELPDDRILPEKPKLRDKWFKARIPDARIIAAEKARDYLSKNPEHARELAFADPETLADFDAPVDQGMLIRAVMETVPHGSDEWYVLDNNLAMVKSMSGSTLSLSGDQSHQAYLDAKREVEAARELKAAVNYAGTREGAMEKWNSDIRAFTAKRVAAIMATEPNSQERKVAIEAFLEEAKTKFSGNTTNAILNQLDLTGIKTKNSQAFIKWAENQIKQVAHAKIDTKEQAELMKASVKAQIALRDINSTEQKDGKFARAVQSAKDIRHWQFVKDKMKKAYIGRWGKFGIFADNLFGGYMPSAMLMSVNTLFFANVPSTALNTFVVRKSAKVIGKNNVDQQVQKDEVKRITQIFNGSGINLAQMEKPTSPSMLHGEKYTNQEQAHWYNFTFEILGRTDNLFRIPTFVDTLARIATKNANGDSAKATVLFKEYIKLGNTNEDAQIARKQALAVANMAVFTQDGTMASALNHIRSQLNTMSRGLLGLEPGGFGLGNVLAPFLKTGANIVEMGLKGTVAPVRQLIQWGKKAQGKQIPDIDKISMRMDWRYFAYTAAITALMAAITSDDDEWYIEPYQTGRRYDPNRPYDSIKVAGVWVKLDLFGPLEVPLRTAAMLVKDWDEKQMAALGDGLMEALGETPLVNQFMDSTMDYATKQPGKWVSSFAYNQINKLMPAQAKSLIRAGSRATDAELDVQALGKTIERKFHRNYGLDGQQLTTNDLINLLTNRLKTNPE